MPSSANNRLWELDIIRFLALVLIIIQHTVIIWTFLDSKQFSGYPEIFNTLGRMGALLFLFLVGMSGYLSYQRRAGDHSFLEIQQYFVSRGLKILGLALALSVVSFIVIPMKPIWFGVLHFIGTAVITLPIFIKFKWLSRVSIPFGLVLGVIFGQATAKSFFLLPLGIQPMPFPSLDYWPYFPWISLVLTGLEVARVLFASDKGKKALFSETIPSILTPLQWLGSHTLLLYLIHPVIIVIIVWIIRQVLGL